MGKDLGGSWEVHGRHIGNPWEPPLEGLRGLSDRLGGSESMGKVLEGYGRALRGICGRTLAASWESSGRAWKFWEGLQGTAQAVRGCHETEKKIDRAFHVL